MPIIGNFQNEMARKADEIFGTNLDAIVRHQFEELQEAFNEATTDEAREEIADAALCSLHLADLNRVDISGLEVQDDFLFAMKMKWARCLRRKWAAPDENGVVHHIKAE